MFVKEIKKLLKKDIIIREDLLTRPLEDMKDEDIKNMSDSIDTNGLINEIDVRLKDGKYELIAGGRRFVATKEDEILAKIYEDVSDIDAMILGLNENIHRKDLDGNVIDAYIYKIWTKGKFKYIKDFAKEINKSPNMLGVIISAGRTKEKMASPVVQRATSRDLERTKPLADHLDIREYILKKEQECKLNAEEIEDISKEIKRKIDNGVEKEVIIKSLEIIIDKNTEKKYLKSKVLGMEMEIKKSQKKDLVTLVHLNEPYHVEVEREDIILIPPKEGSTVTIPGGLKSVTCGGKYINKMAIELFEACGITVMRESDIRLGNKQSSEIIGSVGNIEIVVQIYNSKGWNNPPNDLPLRDIWFVSKDHDEAKMNYAIVKRHLTEYRNFIILGHECINRDNSHIRDCLDGQDLAIASLT